VTNVDDREASHRSAFAHRTGPGGARISPTSAANQEGWPPNEANVLEPATWRLELLIAGDNIRAERTFVTVTFDGTWPDPGGFRDLGALRRPRALARDLAALR
jgi:hypothetical protein